MATKTTNVVKRRATRSTTAELTKKKKRCTSPSGYRTCCCGNAECKEAMYTYFTKWHDYKDPTRFFPWLYIEIPSMPKAQTKSRSKQRRLDRQTKMLRHKLFLRHLGITPPEQRSVVAYPVHFALAL